LDDLELARESDERGGETGAGDGCLPCQRTKKPTVLEVTVTCSEPRCQLKTGLVSIRRSKDSSGKASQPLDSNPHTFPLSKHGRYYVTAKVDDPDTQYFVTNPVTKKVRANKGETTEFDVVVPFKGPWVELRVYDEEARKLIKDVMVKLTLADGSEVEKKTATPGHKARFDMGWQPTEQCTIRELATPDTATEGKEPVIYEATAIEVVP